MSLEYLPYFDIQKGYQQQRSVLKYRYSFFLTMTEIMLEGYSAQHIMKGLLTKLMVMDSKDLSEGKKARIAIKIAEADKNLIDSADETLQLLVLL